MRNFAISFFLYIIFFNVSSVRLVFIVESIKLLCNEVKSGPRDFSFRQTRQGENQIIFNSLLL